MESFYQKSTAATSEEDFAAFTHYDGAGDSDTTTETFPGYPNKTLPTSDSDEVDFMPFSFMKTIKTVVFRFLAHVIRQLRKELCFGCQINHPSQNQHDCLWPASDYFFLTHHRELFDRLINQRFTEAVRRVLSQHYGLLYPFSHSVVRAVTEAFLFELKDVVNIEHEIIVQSERLCNGRSVDNRVLEDVEKFWLGEDCNDGEEEEEDEK